MQERLCAGREILTSCLRISVCRMKIFDHYVCNTQILLANTCRSRDRRSLLFLPAYSMPVPLFFFSPQIAWVNRWMDTICIAISELFESFAYQEHIVQTNIKVIERYFVGLLNCQIPIIGTVQECTYVKFQQAIKNILILSFRYFVLNREKSKNYI